jgi:hypothetical protein
LQQQQVKTAEAVRGTEREEEEEGLVARRTGAGTGAHTGHGHGLG